MSTYVMSDIHGCFTDFLNMLDKIQFTDDDMLYIAGDVVDRGPENYEMLNWVAQLPSNVRLVQGNHDAGFVRYVKMLRRYMAQESMYSDGMTLKETYSYIKSMYYEFDYYGTIDALIKKQRVTLKQLKTWAHILEELPLCYELSINQKRYIIVHAGYVEKEEQLETSLYQRNKDAFFLTAREEAMALGGAPDAVIIFGHTPTIFPEVQYYNQGKVFHKIRERDNCQFYDIDCGIVYRKYNSQGNLACVRLEDHEVYYLYDEA